MKRPNRKRNRPKEVVAKLRQCPFDIFVSQIPPTQDFHLSLTSAPPPLPSLPASRVPRDLFKRGRQPSPERPRCRGQPPRGDAASGGQHAIRLATSALVDVRRHPLHACGLMPLFGVVEITT